MRAGKPCGLDVGGLMGRFWAAQIVQAPRHGTAAIRGSRVTYTPAKGYTGADQFTYMRHILIRCGAPAPQTVVMRVTVVP